jgi:flavin-dependent dehydrogenase
MELNQEYDVAIIGGGLAGLASAIVLARANHSVILFEKEKYPFHKVCGEYISLESWNFLEQLGLPLKKLQLPQIDTLLLTAPNGKSLSTKLPLGGFGISRYALDTMLAQIAKEHGVHLLEEARVDDVKKKGLFQIEITSKNIGQKKIYAKVCCAAFGKKANLDIKWKRSFLQSQDKRLDNYIGIKYHIHIDWPDNLIGLHNFKNGYCGISKVENGRYCLCYLTKAESLRNCNSDIHQLEQEVLYQNPFLKDIISKAQIIQPFPVTISQINFNPKTKVEDHILMLGDAAGMITPLCGNGMSIALHTAKIASVLIDSYLKDRISRGQLESAYAKQWNKNFAGRLQTGRILQRFFGSKTLSNLLVGTFRTLPFLASPVIKMTHGKPF